MSRSRRTVPPFDELSHDVWEQIVGATNNYDLLTHLLFPIVNQPLLRSHYSYTTKALVNAVSEHVLLAVCRLFDPKRDQRMASICNLLRGAPQHHAGDGSLSTQRRERRAEFDSELPRRLTLLKHRSGNVACDPPERLSCAPRPNQARRAAAYEIRGHP